MVTDRRTVELWTVRIEGHEAFGGGGTGLGAGLTLQAASHVVATHVEFVSNTQRGFGTHLLSKAPSMMTGALILADGFRWFYLD